MIKQNIEKKAVKNLWNPCNLWTLFGKNPCDLWPKNKQDFTKFTN